nr:MFS transporter [Helcobacillus massiliensis]
MLALVAVAVAALNLRPGISSLGPVLGTVLEEFGVSSSAGGLLTAIPGLCFAVLGVLAVPIGRRLGLSGAVMVGFAVLVLGILARPFVGSIWLFAGCTILIAGGIALGNVLLPAWIKRHGGERTVRLMTLYTTLLGLGGAVGPLSALLVRAGDREPIEVLGLAAWQSALLIWVVAAAAAAVVWAAVWATTRYDFPADPPSPDGARPVRVPLWRSSTARWMMLMFGLQSMQAYVQMGWMPVMMMDAGISSVVAVWTVFVTNGLGMVGGVVMPTVIHRSRRLAPIIASFGLLTAAGYGAVLLLIAVGADGFGDSAALVALVCALILGVGGWSFPTAIAMIPARSHDPAVTARLSGFVQPIGYLLAAAGPFLVGVGIDRIGSWPPVITALVVAGFALAFAGWRSASGAFVDDQLAEVADARS